MDVFDPYDLAMIATLPRPVLLGVVGVVLIGAVFVLAILFDAPLKDIANPNQTPEVAKAPWYFAGLQELLSHFTPMVAGVLIPGAALLWLVALPYIDRGKGGRIWDRDQKLAEGAPDSVLRDPLLNKGTAFTEEERERFGLRGLLPPHVATQDEQATRVIENLRLAAGADGRGSYNLLGGIERMRAPLERARVAAEAVGLSARLGEVAGTLSYGEQRQLEVGVVLATAPKLMLLDEPTAGMSPEETARMTRMLEGLPREVTMLIIEHDMDVVFSLADRITVLHYGEVLVDGAPEAVRADARVYEVYLGTGDGA